MQIRMRGDYAGVKDHEVLVRPHSSEYRLWRDRGFVVVDDEDSNAADGTEPADDGFDLDNATKRQILEHADALGVDLDQRKKVDELREELRAAMQSATG